MTDWLVVFSVKYGRRIHRIFVPVVARGYGRAVRAARALVMVRGHRIRIEARRVTA